MSAFTSKATKLTLANLHNRPPGVSEQRCALCQREGIRGKGAHEQRPKPRALELTYHHLIPRKVHRRRHFQKNYSRQQLQQGILVCRLCHKGIHKLIDEMTLAREYASAVRLLAHPALQRHIQWVSRQKY